ncbi:nucleotidyltransferase domain-containing protein [Verrucomicrobium spinosum]|uniref:nucleotidyltransferase domain-containing protein n=1 Tax=Verrucomicrobium spinosum TaxID=2736 RepID=UPI0004924E38|nr:nucleotidyltransferase family protein [Verrucomicrobium spinosum]
MPISAPPAVTAVLLTGGCWPTPGQTLLLRAAILDANEALPAWDRWKAENDINHLEAGTFRLLGLLYRNLVRVGVDPADPLLPRLRGIYRNFWTKNQIVLGRKGTVLKALAAEGIPCMLLKGAGLTLTVYRDHGVRPMDDFDLLVPLSRVGQAMDILEGLGWQSQVHAPRELPASIHACSFRDAAEATIDLHWRLCHLPAGRDFDRTLWEGRQLLELHGEPAGVPCATDQFLHTCAHGPQYKAVSPVRWIADAYFLVQQAGGKIDWRRVAEHAPAVGTVQGVQGTLDYLQKHLEVKIPAEASRWLGDLRPTFQERWESRLLGKRLPSPLHRMPLDFSHHLRCSRGQGMWRQLRGFPVYFRHVNNLLPGQFTSHHRARAAYWFRHWLPWYMRQVPRLLQHREVGSVGQFKGEDLRGFYPLEPYGNRLLRWSRPEATVWLTFPEGLFFKVWIDVGRLRAWSSDLSKHLQFSVDGEPLPQSCVKGKQGILTLSIALSAVADQSGRRAELSWACLPHVAAGDSRALGLPVLSVKVATVRPSKSDSTVPNEALSEVQMNPVDAS